MQWVSLPLVALYLSVRCLRDRRYLYSVRERLGGLPRTWEQTGTGAVWFHAVSVGEVMAAHRTLGEMRQSLPGVKLWVSVSTLAGRQLAEQRLHGIADGVFYAPFDYAFCVRRVLRRLQPSLLIVTETEIWPNLWHEARRSGARLLVVNARISDRAFPRYRKFRFFFQAVLAQADRIQAQSRVSASRYLALGVPETTVTYGGNLKYDFDPRETKIPAAIADLLGEWTDKKVWIAASTMPPARADDTDEDDAVIQAFRQLSSRVPNLLLMLAPRKPERFDDVARRLEARGVRYIRRSQLPAAPPPLPAVFLLDSIGELSSLFPLADAVFMGGTLARRGGHNILEPAFSARTIIIGPHMENFPEIGEEFRKHGAVVEIGSPAEMAGAVARVLDGQYPDTGPKARQLAEGKRGATELALQEARRLIDLAVPVRIGAARTWLLPLTAVWAVGTAWRKAVSIRRMRKLAAPVVSVGNIALGGVGKTPFVLWLAKRMAVRGGRPAFLTRGYRRRSPERVAVAPAGGRLPVTLTGDEGQMLLRSGLGPVGISADRYDGGAAVLAAHEVDVFLLDDGFQHWKLARDFDIVLVDAADPFAGGALVPAGRLREPPSSLGRADAIVLTRTREGRSYPGIIAEIRRWNRSAPVFLSRTRPACWRGMDGGSVPIEGPVAAFCGLGNPRSFWQTIEMLGVCTVLRCEFGDHHVYRPSELKRLVAQARNSGAKYLITTQKDLMNLPEGTADLTHEVPLLWLEIEVVVEDGDRLLEMVAAVAGSRVS
jgi:tetraacyldisaccharide 4'-kinase